MLKAGQPESKSKSMIKIKSVRAPSVALSFGGQAGGGAVFRWAVIGAVGASVLQAGGRGNYKFQGSAFV